MKKYISIIVPVYNSEKYIRRCIESLLNQTFINIEIICVNDGSTDKSEDIIKEYANKDKRIRIFNKINGGVSSARNLGMSYAEGKYISFVDSDDWCEKNMFETLYNFAEDNQLDLVNIGYIVEKENGKIKYKDKVDRILLSEEESGISDIMTKIQLGYSVMKLYKRDIINDNNLRFNEDLNFGEDAIFVLDYISMINSIATINEYGYHYVHYKGESLSKKYVYNIEKFLNIFWNKEESLYIKYPSYRKSRQSVGITRHIHGSIMLLYNNYRYGCPFSKQDKINVITRIMSDTNVNKDVTNFKVSSISYKLFVFLFKLKNPYIMNSVYSALFKLKNIFN